LPGVWLTCARIEELGLLMNKFLWPEKRELVTQVLQVNKQGLMLADAALQKEDFSQAYENAMWMAELS